MSCVKSQPWIIRFDDEPIEGDGLVEFRLLYSGQLLGSAKNNPRAGLKHSIRKEFHPQLRRLWESKPSLRDEAETIGRGALLRKHVPESTISPDQSFEAGIKVMARNWNRIGYNFLPLVTSDLVIRCSINILFLRPEALGFLIRGGDLDARIKTVFDALRMPDNLKEAGDTGPSENEDPFFCLLQDDKLISDVSVTTDELLLLPKERNVNANDSFLVIHINLQQV